MQQRGVNCIAEWCVLCSIVMWTVKKRQIDCAAEWDRLFGRALWIVQQSGMDCAAEWCGLCSRVGWLANSPNSQSLMFLSRNGFYPGNFNFKFSLHKFPHMAKVGYEAPEWGWGGGVSVKYFITFNHMKKCLIRSNKRRTYVQ